jgi:hypothetical protein
MRTAIALSALASASALVTVVLLAIPQVALAQTQDKAFCMRTPTGALNCTFDSLAQCQQAAQMNPGAGMSPMGSNCISRPGTTGAGGMEAPRGSGPNSMDRVPPGAPNTPPR